MIKDLKDLKRVGPALDADLKAVFAKHGLTWVKRGATIDPGNGSVSYRITLSTSAGGRDDVARADWDRSAARLGLRPEWFGREIRAVGAPHNVTIIGLMPKRTKYPVLVEDPALGRRLYTVDYVRRMLGGE